MFERFTNDARHVIVVAQDEARRLSHSYIGTEHVLLGLLSEPQGIAFRVLQGSGMSLEAARQEVIDIVGTGKGAPGGHIPFTPRAKRVLELALREALQLRHTYIGTEHILLGLIREGDGVGAKVLSQHGHLNEIRAAVLDLLPAGPVEVIKGRRWRRRQAQSAPGGSDEPAQQAELSATPAADSTLSEATRLAGAQPVGSHHLLLAALADPDTAAARALASLGIDLAQAKEALRSVDVAGTSDEQPEEAGRRQMVIRVADDRLTVEATDPVILAAARATLQALGDKAEPPGTIRGDQPACASLSTVWEALQNSFGAIQRRATSDAPAPGTETDTGTGTEVA